MKLSKYTLITIILIQAVLCVVAFNKYFGAPNNYMFQETYDGFKNYMTFQTYLSQPNDEILKYSQMNYPYGEYIFYTDNSPLFAVPLKLFCNYVYDISAYSVLIYNGIIIFGYFLSAILLYLILKPFIKNNWLLILFSLAFTWMHPQMLRPFVGHHNLGLASVLLFNILGTLKISMAENKKQEWKWLIILTLSLIGSGFIHLYYLLINGFFIGFWGLAWGIDNFINKKNWLQPIIKTWSASLIGILTCFFSIRIIDTEYASRGAAGGYNWDVWALKIKAIFSSYEFNTIRPIQSVEWLTPENHAYLGAATILALVGILVLVFLKKFKIIKPHFKIFLETENRILLYWLFAAIMMSFVALGSVVHTKNFVYSNYLSLLFYGDLFSDKFTQFRCLGRFSWFLFWAVNICFALLTTTIIKHTKYNYLKYIIFALFAILTVDLSDFVRKLNNTHHENQFVDALAINEYETMVENINVAEYQAILPLPFFHTGTEVTDITIDAPYKWLNSAGKLSYLSGLPLMASQMSRTAIYQAEELYTIFSEDGISQNLLNKMNEKPILVLFSKNYNKPESSDWYSNSEKRKSIALEGAKIIEQYNMTLVYETENHKLYQWDLYE